MDSENIRELPIPLEIEDKQWAVELLRVWAADGKQHITLMNEMWNDPASWGVFLVDLAKHIAKAYGEDECVLARIKEGFDVEWCSPTSP